MYFNPKEKKYVISNRRQLVERLFKRKCFVDQVKTEAPLVCGFLAFHILVGMCCRIYTNPQHAHINSSKQSLSHSLQTVRKLGIKPRARVRGVTGGNLIQGRRGRTRARPSGARVRSYLSRSCSSRVVKSSLLCM